MFVLYVNIMKAQEKLIKLQKRKKQLLAQEHKLQLTIHRQQRKNDNKLKILFGAFLLRHLEDFGIEPIRPNSYFNKKDINFLQENYKEEYERLQQDFKIDTSIYDINIDEE